MKKGYSLFSFGEDADLDKLLPVISEAGYDGVEPVLSENGYLNPGMSDDRVLAIREMALKYNLNIPSVGVWSLWKNNLVSNDAGVRRNAMDIVRFQLRAARLLGSECVLIVPGYVGTEFVPNSERVRYDIAYERVSEALTILSSDAEKEGVKIAIENVWNRFLLSPIETARLIDEIGSPYVNVYFDVGNIIYTGYPEDWIEILSHRIVCIHLSDYRFSQTGLGAFVDLFAGDVNFPAVAESLKKIEYNGWIILEMLPNYKQFPEISIFSNKRAVDKIAELIGA
jgi:hexulose-6-phosphate isomerase